MIFRNWFRLRTRGLVSGLFQVRCLFRAARSVANCVLVSGGCTLVVQRSFPVGVEVICEDLTFIFAFGGAVV